MYTISLTTNVSSLNTQRYLTDHTAALREGYSRLSSGKRINSSADDAAGLSIASGLDLDCRVFNQAVRNVNEASEILDIASGAIATFKQVLLRLRELATQSANGVFEATQRQALEREAEALVDEYNRVLQSTATQGRRLFAPENRELVVQAGYSRAGTLRFFAGAMTEQVTGDGTFSTPQIYPAGVSPFAIVAADFDRDGLPDIATADIGSSALRVLLGNGDGTLGASQSFAAGTSPKSIAVGDLDGDGAPDLIVGRSANSVTVLRGNGDGSFQPAQSFAAGLAVNAVALGDYNGDEQLDIVTADFGGATASILLGLGDGTFSPPQSFAVGGSPVAVAVADLDDDGTDDVVVSGLATGVSVLLGHGDGTFQASVDYAAGVTPYAIAIGDFDLDGIADLVTANTGDATASVLCGIGNGTFAPRQDFSTSGGSFSLAIGDFNGDGVPDLVTTDTSNSTANVLLGNGSDGFGTPQNFGAGANPYSVAVVDLNRDGVMDLVSAAGGSGGVGVLLGNQVTATIVSGLDPLSGIHLGSLEGARAAHSVLSDYSQQVETVASAIASGTSRLSIAASVLQLGATNFRDAQHAIIDADVAEELAKLVANQMLQQVGSCLLSQANHAPDLALQLLAA